MERQPSNWIDAIVEDKRAAVADQVAAKMDVGAWFATLTKRMKEIAKDQRGAAADTQEVSFTYDALDRRIAKTVDADGAGPVGEATAHFVYDREDVILDFIDPDDAGPQTAALDQRYLHGAGIDQVIAQESGRSHVYWLLTDHLGTVRDMVRDDDTPAVHTVFGAFGNMVARTNQSVGTRYSFAGRELDPETGMLFYRTRYYDSSLARFATEDTIGFNSSDSNMYRYALNSPTSSIDPYGRDVIVGYGQDKNSVEFRKVAERTASDLRQLGVPAHAVPATTIPRPFFQSALGIEDTRKQIEAAGGKVSAVLLVAHGARGYQRILKNKIVTPEDLANLADVQRGGIVGALGCEVVTGRDPALRERGIDILGFPIAIRMSQGGLYHDRTVTPFVDVEPTFPLAGGTIGSILKNAERRVLHGQ